MKLVNFKKDGVLRLGILTENGVIDVSAEARTPETPVTMAEALALGQKKAVEILTPVMEKAERYIAEKDIEYAPAVDNPGKILCVGLNYKAHVMESGKWDKLPEKPVIFSKFNNTLVGHKGRVIRNKTSKKHDYEAEIVVVIGKEAAYVEKDSAMDCVFGYTLANDISARDLQSYSHQWLLGKSCDTFCPLGPCIVTADALAHDEMHLVGRKNGEIRQEGDSDDLIFDVPTLVSYLSKCLTLKPGDIILTGTPSGVIGGRPADQQDWLTAGDEVSVHVEQIGTLLNYISD